MSTIAQTLVAFCRRDARIPQEVTAGIWHLPTDLTLCAEGYNGEHATSVNGTGNPTLEDMITIGTKIKMKQERCYEIFKEVESACGDLLLHRIK